MPSSSKSRPFRESEMPRESIISSIGSFPSVGTSYSSPSEQQHSSELDAGDGGGITATINNARRNFYQTCNMKGLGYSDDVHECASLGRQGTFRANAVARRYVNTSRRNLLKQSQGISVQSLLSNMTGEYSERAPLNIDIPENERVTNFESSTSSLISDGYGSTRTSSIHDSIVSTVKNGKQKEQEKEENIWINFLLIWIGKPISILLLFFPFALAAHYRSWGPQWIFWLNFLVMVPLASILGDFTEEAALHTNDIVGGLLNASFGNAVEVVVAFNALMNNEIRVVQASMIGSIFSNLLLVLGCCFLFGGFYHKEQRFSSMNATTGMGLLALFEYRFDITNTVRRIL